MRHLLDLTRHDAGPAIALGTVAEHDQVMHPWRRRAYGAVEKDRRR